MLHKANVVEAVNFNSPGQVVIAGNTAAVERAMAAAKEAGAKRALPLPVSVPSHCSLMKPAAEKLAEALKDITIKQPQIRVIHNADVASYDDADKIKDDLGTPTVQPGALDRNRQRACFRRHYRISRMRPRQSPRRPRQTHQ